MLLNFELAERNRLTQVSGRYAGGFVYAKSLSEAFDRRPPSKPTLGLQEDVKGM